MEPSAETERKLMERCVYQLTLTEDDAGNLSVAFAASGIFLTHLEASDGVEVFSIGEGGKSVPLTPKEIEECREKMEFYLKAGALALEWFKRPVSERTDNLELDGVGVPFTRSWIHAETGETEPEGEEENTEEEGGTENE
jgi:hypothetical protein